MFAEPPTADDGPEKSGKGRPNSGAAELAAVALAGGSTAAAAAEVANVNERTIRKWLARPAFKARVENLRAEAVGRAMGRLSDGMTEAADALRKLVGHKDPHVRFKAAKAVLELALKMRETIELERRVLELETAIAGGAS